MKKVCVFIDKNLSWCLILFAVVFGFSALEQPFVYASSPFGQLLVSGIGNLLVSFTQFSSNRLFYIILLSLLLIICTYILLFLMIKNPSFSSKNYSFILLNTFSILMLGITLFAIIYWTSNSDYIDIMTYWLMYLPSLLGFIFCTFFSMTFCIYKYMQKPKKPPKSTKKQRIDELQKQIQDLQQKINNNEKTE